MENIEKKPNNFQIWLAEFLKKYFGLVLFVIVLVFFTAAYYLIISPKFEEATVFISDKTLEEQKDALKAQILFIISDAEKVIGDGYTISAGIVGECEIKYTRKEYRNFRVNFKKEK